MTNWEVSWMKGAPIIPLIWAARHTSMARHILKVTVQIADDIFERVQELARKEKTSFRALTEQGLRLVLMAKDGSSKKLPPLVTVKGRGIADKFKNAPWENLRDEINCPSL